MVDNLSWSIQIDNHDEGYATIHVEGIPDFTEAEIPTLLNKLILMYNEGQCRVALSTDKKPTLIDRLKGVVSPSAIRQHTLMSLANNGASI